MLHLSGRGASRRHHITAVKAYTDETECSSRATGIYQRLFQICLTVIRTKAAEQHLKIWYL